MDDESTILLAQLMQLLTRADRCPVCCGPSSAFEGKHLTEYTRLRERILKRLARRPN